MYDAAAIQELKQSNVSVNAEKTKNRLTSLWKSAGKDAQDAILSLSGVVRSSIQRAYKTGNASAKIIIPIAQILQVPPTYLTGETDELEGYADDQLKEFLDRLGYKGIRIRQKRGRRPGSRNAVKEEAIIIAEPEREPEELSEEAREFLNTVDEETLILLMRAMLVREKIGGRNAAQAQQLKLLLFEINQG